MHFLSSYANKKDNLIGLQGEIFFCRCVQPQDAIGRLGRSPSKIECCRMGKFFIAIHATFPYYKYTLNIIAWQLIFYAKTQER
jgi:hypothetical protein